MLITILVLIIIAAILLIIAILVQNPKSGGLASEFGGGGSTSQMFGVQRTGDLLENLTWGFFTFIIVGALVTAILFGNVTQTTTNENLNVESSQAAPITPAPALPAQGMVQGTSRLHWQIYSLQILFSLQMFFTPVLWTQTYVYGEALEAPNIDNCFTPFFFVIMEMICGSFGFDNFLKRLMNAMPGSSSVSSVFTFS